MAIPTITVYDANGAKQTVNTTPNGGQATAANSLPMVPAASPAATWAGTTIDMTAYSVVTITVTTAPTTAYTPQWSPDNTNWFAMSGVDLNYNTLTTIGTTFTGAISFKGGGYIRLNGGTGGVFQIAGGQ